MSKVFLFILRFLFAACIVILATLAWSPADAMKRTALGGHTEHLVAYLGTTIVMGFALQRGPHLAVQCSFLGAYAAILEAGQLMIQGRHSSWGDLAFSCMGIGAGGLILWRGRPRLLDWLGK